MVRVLGVPDTAVLMEMSESALDNRIYERRDQAFSVRQSLRLQEISGTTRFAEEVAKMSGGTFVLLPSVDEVDNEPLLMKFNELYGRLGQLSARFSEYTADDEISERERAHLAAMGNEIHQTLQELLALTFRIYCPTDARQGLPSQGEA